MTMLLEIRAVEWAEIQTVRLNSQDHAAGLMV
jgi:hypothetical protein